MPTRSLITCLALALASHAPASEPVGPPTADPEARALMSPRARPTESTPLVPSATPKESWLDRSDWGRTAISLGGVLALIVGGSRLLRRFARSSGSLASAAGAGGRAPAGIIDILGRFPVARGQTLLLLKIERRVLLVCQTPPGRGSPGGMSVLAQIDEPEEVASILIKSRDRESESLARRFEATLRSFEHRMDAAERTPGAGTPRPERPASAALRRRLDQLRAAGVSA
ncbi:MAG: hypothetical protein FJ255_04635 [Phycisphaerae bacterium]|nr:hypothetical protein [Phycisphaerae bacterium]